MTYTDPATPITATPITIAFYLTNIGDNIRHLRANTGAGDPGSANKTIVSTGAATSIWSTIPDAAMTNLKVSKAGDTMTGQLITNAGISSAAITMQSGQAIAWPSENAVKEDYTGTNTYTRTVSANTLNDLTARDYVISKTGVGILLNLNGTNAATPSLLLGTSGHTIWHSGNDGAGSTLDADLHDGKNVGHAAGDVPWNESGVLNAGFRAQFAETLFDGSGHVAAGNASGNIAINNGTKCTNLNADLLDGLTTGNGNGNIPISNGTVCTNLNADLLDGLSSASFAQLSGGAAFGGAVSGTTITGSGALSGTTVSASAAGGFIFSGTEGGGTDALYESGSHTPAIKVSNNQIQSWFAGGTAITGSGTYTGTWTQASDRRLKTDIDDLHGALAAVMSLRPITYRDSELHRKLFGSSDNRMHLGLIAQDVETVFPSLVGSIDTDEGSMKTVDYARLVVPLVAAVQDLAAKVKILEAAQ